MLKDLLLLVMHVNGGNRALKYTEPIPYVDTDITSISSSDTNASNV